MDQEIKDRFDRLDHLLEKGDRRFDDLDRNIADISGKVETYGTKIVTLERGVDRHERAIFGMQDPETLAWIPGLLQNTADFVKVKKWVIGLGATVATASVLNVLHNYGVSDALFGALGAFFGGGHPIR